MTVKEAEASLKRWHRWAACVRSRWQPDSPMARLAQRRVLQAELRLLECQDEVSRQKEKVSQENRAREQSQGVVE